MEEWVQTPGMLLILAVITVFVMIKNNREAARRRHADLKSRWGTLPQTEYSADDLEAVSHFARQRAEGRFFVDDITWNDLDLDQVFLRMNQTVSSCGESMLYAALRLPEFDEAVLLERDRLMEYFASREKEREAVQLALLPIGKQPGLSVSDALTAVCELEPKSTVGYKLLAVSLLVGIGLLFLVPIAGVAVCVVTMTANALVHSRKSHEIYAYLRCLSSVLKMQEAAKRISALPLEGIEKYREKLARDAASLARIRKRCATLVNTKTVDGDVSNLLFSYFHTFFLLDFIEFYAVIQELGRKKEIVLELMELLGLLDFVIAASSYRQCLPYYCKPQFAPDGGKRSGCVLDLEDLYHPLLTDPVPNSISARGGILLTGSNATGKSTFLKALALNVILAQSVCTSLSRSYRGVLCRVMTSMALKDDIISGESYYLVEIRSLKRILDAAAQPQPLLCVIDEVLRGTNTIERIAASSRILASMRRPHVICCAATHDIELSYMLEELYTNYHFEEEVTDSDVRFSFLLKEGRTMGRNAIALLDLIGYDKHLTAEARQAAEEFERDGFWKSLPAGRTYG